jgi:hypothetical protein
VCSCLPDYDVILQKTVALIFLAVRTQYLIEFAGLCEE